MNKFFNFLDSLKTPSNHYLMENVKEAYSLIFEVGEPQKIKGARNVNRVVNSGTNSAYQVFGKKFKTSAGNVVEVIFIPESDGYEVVFNVNGSYDDDATVGTSRDPEIFSGVTYFVKKIADEKDINRMTINPRSGKGDTTTVRGLDVDEKKAEVIKELNKFEESLQNAEYPTEPSESIKKIYEKNGKEWNAYDTYMKGINLDITRLKNLLSGDVDPSYGQGIATTGYGLKLKPQVTNVEQPERLSALLQEYGKALTSNTEEGLKVTENRRTKVYDKLLKRNMTGWNVEKNGDDFVLTR